MMETVGMVVLSRQEAEILANVLSEMPAKHVFGALTVLVQRIAQAEAREKAVGERARESAQTKPASQEAEGEGDSDEE